MNDATELEKLRTSRDSVKELSSIYAETLEDFKGFSECLESTKSLWMTYNKCKLVKIGLTLITFQSKLPSQK